jgi:hypothetical protein
MRNFSPLRTGLLIIECARFSFLTGVLAILRHNASAEFPWQIFAVPNALFLIIALFLWLDSDKYSVYLILYISGKLLCLFSELISCSGFFRNSFAFNIKIMNPAVILVIAFFCDLVLLVIAILLSSRNKQGGV